jgi:hypothetical protein
MQSPAWTEVAPAFRNRVDELRLSSNPALVAGFSFARWRGAKPIGAQNAESALLARA